MKLTRANWKYSHWFLYWKRGQDLVLLRGATCKNLFPLFEAGPYIENLWKTNLLLLITGKQPPPVIKEIGNLMIKTISIENVQIVKNMFKIYEFILLNFGTASVVSACTWRDQITTSGTGAPLSDSSFPCCHKVL